MMTTSACATIPHRRIKQLAMVVLQWHWLTSRGGVLRANPSTEDSCGVRFVQP